MERRVIREVGPDGTRDTPFLEAAPDWFDYLPRELRFFQDWMNSSAASSAATHRVFAHWALDFHDCTYKGEREIGFTPQALAATTRAAPVNVDSCQQSHEALRSVDCQHDARRFGPSADGPDRRGRP
jgi:hypothetical protein